MLIKKIKIEKFRSIAKQEIIDISNVLVLIGENNTGKSAIIQAIRAFWNDYKIKPSDITCYSDECNIIINFQIQESDLETLAYTNKFGLKFLPSNKAEFNELKIGTIYNDKDWETFKSIRDEIVKSTDSYSEISKNKDFEYIWKNSLFKKLNVNEGIMEIKMTATANKERTEVSINYITNDTEMKDAIKLLPKLAFIDDERNFSGEEVGGAKTFTNELFADIIKSDSDVNIRCNNCLIHTCEECVSGFKDKSILDLSIEELEKLITYKSKNEVDCLSEKLSKNFERNYKNDYKILLEPIVQTDKGISITTKVYDPNLKQNIELSKVGAGIRSIYLLSLLQTYCEQKYQGALFLIEEPEIYLHPALQKVMADLLEKISDTNQIIFTTHSTVMLKGISVDSVRLTSLDITDTFTQINTANIEIILKELGYSTADVIHKDFVLIVEGKQDVERFKLLLKRFYPTIEQQKILFIDSKGCINIKAIATLIFLDCTTLKENFIIIRDSDTKSKEAVIKEFKESRGYVEHNLLNNIIKNMFVTKYSALDNYFADLKLISEILDIAIEQLEELVKQAVNSSKTEINKNWDKHNLDNEIKESMNRYFFESDLSFTDEYYENVRKYIRAHNLINLLKRPPHNYKENEYMKIAEYKHFADIIDFLNVHDFFKGKFEPTIL